MNFCAITRCCTRAVAALLIVILLQCTVVCGNAADEKSISARRDKAEVACLGLLSQAAFELEGRDTIASFRNLDYGNLEIALRALAKARIARATVLPEPNQAFLAKPALEAVIASDYLGDYKEGDAYAVLVSSAEEMTDPGMTSYSVNHLVHTGRVREADLVKESITKKFKNFPPHNFDAPDLPTEPRFIQEDELLTKNAQAAIDNGDLAAIAQNTSEMLRRYSERHVDLFERDWGIQKRQNLVATALGFARRLSDKGLCNESSNLIRDFRQACARKEPDRFPSFLFDFELTVNAIRAQQDPMNYWVKVENEIRSDDTNSDGIIYELPVSESLRTLAVLFYKAGEFDRAEILIERALSLFQSDDLVDTPGHRIVRCWSLGKQGDLMYLNLDRAYVLAKLGREKEANKSVAEAFENPALIESRYGFKIAQIADAFEENGRSDYALALLENAHRKLVTPQDSLSANDDYDAPARALIDYSLAKYLISHGEMSRGKTIAQGVVRYGLSPKRERATRDPTVYLLYCASVLLGGSAVLQRDFGEAADDYMQAATKGIDQLWLYQAGSDPRIFWLRKAITFAEKASVFAPDKKSALHSDLAGLLIYRTIEGAVDEQAKAVSLLPDTSPRKLKALEKLADMQKQLPLTTISKPVDPMVAYTRGFQKHILTDEEKLFALEHHPEIESRRRAAALAQAQGDPMAYARFLRLADAEASLGLSSEVKDHLNTAIALYKTSENDAPHAEANTLIPLAMSIFELQSDDGASAKDIMLKAASKVEAIDGRNSWRCRAQYGVAVEVLAAIKEDDVLKSVLDKFLALPVSAGSESELKEWAASRRSNSNYAQVYYAAELQQNERLAVSLIILRKTLEAQLASMPKDDPQIIETKWRIANALSSRSSDKIEEESSLYNEVYGYLCKQVGENKARSMMPQSFLPGIGLSKQKP